MNLPAGWPEMLATMRDQASATHLGETGFYPVNTKSRGSVPIWYEDINKCATDDELVALIRRCISE